MRTVKLSILSYVGVPVILKEPDPTQEVPIGECLVLSVQAECHPSPPVYRWFRICAGKETQLEGHTEAVLNFRICTFEDAGQYFCVVGNPFLGGQLESWRASNMTAVRVLPHVVEEPQLSHGFEPVQDEGTDIADEGGFSFGEVQQPESLTNSERQMDRLGNNIQRTGVLVVGVGVHGQGWVGVGVSMHLCVYVSV